MDPRSSMLIVDMNTRWSVVLGTLISLTLVSSLFSQANVTSLRVADMFSKRIVNSKAVVTATALDPFRAYLSCIPEEDWRARQTVWTVLAATASACVQSVGLVAAAAIGRDLVTALLPTAEKEGDENTRITSFFSLSAWMSISGVLQSVEVMELFKGGVLKPKPMAALFLMSLSVATDNIAATNGESAVEPLLPLFPSLVSIVKEAVKKPLLVHLDALFAMKIMIEMTVSQTGREAFLAVKLGTVLSSSSSFFYCSALHQQLWNLSETPGYKTLYQSATLARIRSLALASTYLTTDSLFSESADTWDAVANTMTSGDTTCLVNIVDKYPAGPLSAIVFGLLHRDLNVRKAAANAVSKATVTAQFSFVSSQALHCMLCLVSLVGKDREQKLKLNMMDLKALRIYEETGERQSLPWVPAPSHIADAVLACVSAESNRLSGDRDSSSISSSSSSASSHVDSSLSDALLLCCHPLVSSSVLRAKQLAKTMLRALYLESGESGSFLARPETASLLNSKLTLAAWDSTSSSVRTAVNRVMLVLATQCGDQGKTLVQQSMLRVITSQLNSPEVESISTRDMTVFLDPNAAMAVVDSAPVEDVRITNADRKKAGGRSTRKGTGAFGGDMGEEEDWAEQVKREKAKKLSQSQSGSGGMTDAQEKRAKEVQEVVERVNAVVLKYKYSLETIRFLVDNDPDTILNSPTPVVPPVTKLLGSSLLSVDVMNCLGAMCRSLEQDLRPISSDLANSLRLVVTTLDTQGSRKESSWAQRLKEIVAVSGPLCRCIGVFHNVLARGIKLQPSTIQLIYPVLFGVLGLPSLVPGCEAAFMVIDGCWPNLDAAESKGKDSEIAYCKASLASLAPLRKGVLEICLKVLAKFRVDPSPDKLFLRAATQQELSPGDWTPILGSIGILSDEIQVRNVCLRAVMVMALRGASLKTNPLLESRLWLSQFDSDPDLRQLAEGVWSERGVPLSQSYVTGLLPLLGHEYQHVRESSAKAIIGGVVHHPSAIQSTIDKLKQFLLSALPQETTPPVSAGKEGQMLSTPIRIMDQHQDEDVKGPSRAAIAVAFATFGEMKNIPTELAPSIVPDLIEFILTYGVVDVQTEVQEAMLAAGRSLLDGYGAELSGQLLSLLESVLNRQPSKDEDLRKFDLRHEATVVLLGAVGKHLDKGSDNVVKITRALVQALSTPSESVQKSVADCLTPLVQALKTNDATKEMLEGLMVAVVGGETYGDRRGAAFGLSAFVKGLGIPCLKQHDIVTRLKDACTSGSVNNRQGALFAFECLSDRLGLLFEPYIITILPILLKSFSHPSDHVREAAQLAAKVIMGRLSAHGVKQVLTPILTSLTEESAWKSRQEAIRLLGTMAHCAPKQLASCLPQIVPRLVEAGSDPHPKVKESAKSAMGDISSVIRNPEVKRLSPVLLAALADPATKTKEALEALLDCEFMHSIDAPSLAILIPILGRALRDRSADLKRRSSAITGNICSMITDPKVLVPYLHQILPGLKEVLVDPIPDVRASSAKALGNLMSGVGEQELQDLLPWLLDTLVSEASPVERSGAAQGLAEVCVSLGQERMTEIVRVVLELRSHLKAAAREGMQWLLSFLPAALGDAFAAYIGTCLPVVLMGLSDDNEGVREVAMRGGQVIVNVCGRNHTLELLPSLTSGMFDEDWRIRQSSVSLLGELLYQIGDTRAVGLVDADNEEDDMDDRGGTSSRITISIRAHIGEKEADAVFASLYIVRSDTSITVRQIALQVWKSIVSNTPRTLREIMPVLVKQLIEKLSSDSAELRTVTGKSLGEVVKKLGDYVLPEVVPHLQRGLSSSDESVRQGVCLGLSEILSASSHRQVEEYIDVLVEALQEALCDASDDVRGQAAQAFYTLFKSVGVQAISEVVPALLERLEANDESGMLGLREVVQVRPRDLLEYLLPRLLVSPMSFSSANALSAVASVAGNQLAYHCQMIVSGFISELISVSEDAEKSGDSARLEAVKSCAGDVMGSITSTGVNAIVSELGKEVEHDFNSDRRRWGCWLTGQFCGKSKADYSDYVPVIIKHVISRVADMEKKVLAATVEALGGLFTAVGPEAMMEHLDFVRSCISSTASDSKHRKGMGGCTDAAGDFLLPLLTLPQSLDPLLPTFIHTLMNGSAQQREVAATGIAELAAMSDAAVLKPYLIKTAGPLIRVIGDRFPSGVKYAILQALTVLLNKGAASLKAFVPQLQTTFVKALSDPSKQVRMKAAAALGQLMSMSTRIDPLLAELSISAAQADSVAVKASIFQAMAQVLERGGDKATPTGLDRCTDVALLALGEEEESARNAAARCIGGIAAYSSDAKVSDLILDITGGISNVSPAALAGRLVACGWALKAAGARSVEVRDDAFALLCTGFADGRAVVKIAACSAVASCMIPQTYAGKAVGTEAGDTALSEHIAIAIAVINNVTPSLRTMINDPASDVKKAAIIAVKEAAKHHPGTRVGLAKAVVPGLIPCVSEITISVKVAAERAMKYLLEVGAVKRFSTEESTALATFVSTADADSARFIKEYARRTLTRLDEE
eukprot:gene3729-7411_t